MDSFLPSQRSMPYTSPQPAPSLGWLSQDRGDTNTTRQSREDTQPKAAHQAASPRVPTHVPSDLSPLRPVPQRWVVVGVCVCVRGLRVSEGVHTPCASFCVCVCVRALCDKTESLGMHRFLSPWLSSVTNLLSAASKQNGETKPMGFLIYHSAKSSMFHKRSFSQTCHDHIF